MARWNLLGAYGLAEQGLCMTSMTSFDQGGVGMRYVDLYIVKSKAFPPSKTSLVVS